MHFRLFRSKDFRSKAILKASGVMFALFMSLMVLASCNLFPSDANVLASHKYAIIVGINTYTNLSADSQLSYCVADATSMYTMLKATGWDADLLTASTDTTKSAIQAALKSVPDGQDAFLFYYSGHGAQKTSDEAYLVPSDYDGVSASSMIAASEFSSWLQSVSASNKSVILDSCYSGAFVNPGDSIDSIYDVTSEDGGYSYTSLQKSTALEMFFAFGDLLARNASAALNNVSSTPLVISAAGWNAQSQEAGGHYEHGIFTYYFLEAASLGVDGKMKGDADGDRILSCLEAYHYAERQLETQADEFGFVPHISGGLRDFSLIDSR